MPKLIFFFHITTFHNGAKQTPALISSFFRNVNRDPNRVECCTAVKYFLLSG